MQALADLITLTQTLTLSPSSIHPPASAALTSSRFASLQTRLEGTAQNLGSRGSYSLGAGTFRWPNPRVRHSEPDR